MFSKTKNKTTMKQAVTDYHKTPTKMSRMQLINKLKVDNFHETNSILMMKTKRKPNGYKR